MFVMHTPKTHVSFFIFQIFARLCAACSATSPLRQAPPPQKAIQTLYNPLIKNQQNDPG